jgi:hypothetical protein
LWGDAPGRFEKSFARRIEADAFAVLLISQADRDDKTQDDKAAMRRLRVRHLRTSLTS